MKGVDPIEEQSAKTYVRQSEFADLSLNTYLNKHYKINNKRCKKYQMYWMWYVTEMKFN